MQASPTQPATSQTRPAAASLGPLVAGTEGLIVGQSGLRIDFGRTEESTLPAVAKLLGKPPSSVDLNMECGAGPLRIATWTDAGLQLLFQGGDFRGWVVTEASVATENGLRVGGNRDQIIASGGGVRASTLGDEFDLNGIGGLLDEKRRITVLWSGVTCFFR